MLCVLCQRVQHHHWRLWLSIPIETGRALVWGTRVCLRLATWKTWPGCAFECTQSWCVPA
jgi:hypothetical protein